MDRSSMGRLALHTVQVACVLVSTGCSAGHSDPEAEHDPGGAGSDAGALQGTEAGTGGADTGALQGTEAGTQADAGSVDGTVTPDGFALFVLDPSGPAQVTLRTLASNVQRTADGGFALTGTVLIDAADNAQIPLDEADVTLGYNASKGSGLQEFEGTARLPFPNLGFMQGVRLDQQVNAAVGYAAGQDIPDPFALITADRKYVTFTFSTGITANIGELSINAAGKESVTMTLDPSDPAFFLPASLSGWLGPVPEASVGFSIGGKLPFTPETTWGIDAESASFNGHLWLGGAFDLNHLNLPLWISGNTVLNVDPNAEGDSVFTDPQDGFRFGSNSEFAVALSAGTFELEVPLTKASVFGSIKGEAGAATYSGSLDSKLDWLPAAVPLKSSHSLKASGTASTTPKDNAFSAEGDLILDGTKLSSWSTLKINDLSLTSATLSAETDGLTVTGVTLASFSPHVGFTRSLATVAFFDGNPKHAYVAFEGSFAVSGVDLGTKARARLKSTGVAITGSYQTPSSAVAIQGSITQAGVELEGTAPVTISIVADKQLTETVTDADACGTETVTNTALCGSKTVTDGELCGNDAVTDATLCGETTVKDPVLCGTTHAPNATECGTHQETNAAVCGYDTYTDPEHCGIGCGGIFGCSCTVTRTCNVASTCTFANTCSVPNTCDIPKTCVTAETCTVAKTCDKHTTLPDFEYGSFTGDVQLTVDSDGLGGSVSGEYCPIDADCVALDGGRVVVVESGVPLACITVDEAGEVCAEF